MIVEIDAGNTRIKWRVLSEQSVQSRGIVNNQDIELCLKALNQISMLSKIRIASVADENIVKRIAEYCSQRNCTFIEAKTEKNTAGVTCGYSDPSTMGVDRWLATVAAYNRFRSPCVIIDAGTTVTIDIINDEGEHLGGYILPGLEMARKAILAGTSNLKLNISDYKHSKNLSPGKSTEQCIIRGEFLMLKSLIESNFEGLMDRKKVAVIVTGGNSQNLVTILDESVYFEPDLVLDGLKFSAP